MAGRIVGQDIKAHCNKCAGPRNCKILAKEAKVWEEVIDGGRHSIEGVRPNLMLKCLGCESVSMQVDEWFSEDFDYETGAPNVKVTNFPPAISRRSPEWMDGAEFFLLIPHEIGSLIKEIYSSVHTSNHRLASMGIRALVEDVADNKGAADGPFPAKVEHLLAEGYLSKHQKELVTAVIELGHAGIHRKHVPTADQLNAALDVVEGMLAGIYVHPNRSNLLSKIPERKRKVKAAGRKKT